MSPFERRMAQATAGNKRAAAAHADQASVLSCLGAVSLKHRHIFHDAWQVVLLECLTGITDVETSSQIMGISEVVGCGVGAAGVTGVTWAWDSCQRKHG